MIACQVFKEQFYARDFVDLPKLLKRITTNGLQVNVNNFIAGKLEVRKISGSKNQNHIARFVQHEFRND